MAKSSRGKRETIGMIGLGLMGRAFSGSLLADGHAVAGTDPSPSARAKFKKMGGVLAASPREVAEAASAVFLSVPNSKIALACAEGPGGFLAARKLPRLVIDTTTADPEDAKRMEALCRKKGVPFLEARVSGGSASVAQRQGLFLAGGGAKARRLGKALLGRLLSDQVHCGPVGSASVIKIIINYLASMERCAIAESLRLGERCGIPGRLLLDAITRSASDSRQVRNRGPRMIARRFRNPASTMAVITKDIRLGLLLARRTGSLAPVGRASLPFFQEALRSGYARWDSSAVFQVYLDREKRGRGKKRKKAGRRRA
ncbi:MAG: NAD(P)-dependent oxidoreductase [Nitrospinota bacterium]